MNVPVLRNLHIGGDHGVVASNINCSNGEVNLYDSLYSVTSAPIQMLLRKVFEKYYHSVQSNVAVMTVDYLPLHLVLH